MVEPIRRGVGRVTGALAGVVSGAVLLREAARTSRRWQTYAARTAFSGVLLGVLLLGIWVAVESTRSATVDTANLGWVGRALFIGFAVVQTLLAMVLAPLQTASAIIEETDERTMEMLVLTKLRPGQILSAKVLSRILVLVTIVCGALPVMALVVNLGGVSTIEVVAVTVHTLTTVIVLSALGAFFALFTRSPMLAMAASATYAMPFFVLLPMAYVLCTGNPYDSAHFSTFAASTARSWSALITPLSYVPSLVVVSAVTVPLFQLKVSNADFRHAFSDDVWRTPTWLKASAAWFVAAVITVPVAGPVCWYLNQSGTTGLVTDVVRVLATAILWALFSLLAALGTWAFLRVGMDVTDGIDSVFTGTPAGAASAERPSGEVGSNPVFWREARPRTWLATTAPIFVTWGLLLLGVFQTGWWIVPGGVLTIGIANAAGAVVLAAWLAARSIAEERRRGTLEVLLATTLPSASVVSGKFAAAALPTLPLLLLSAPLITFGVPHAGMMFDSDVSVPEQFLRGLASWIWLLPIWATTIVLSLIVALRTSRPRSAFGLVAIGLAGVLGLPSVVARLFPDVALVTLPALLLAPPLAGPFAWWQIVLSTLACGLLCAGLVSLLTRRLRPWAGMMAALLALVLASSDARAETIPDADTIARMEQVFRLRMTARPIADGLYREGRFTTVWVGIENAGPATVGTVTMEALAGAEPTRIVFEREVELPEGGKKELLILVKPGIGEPDRLVKLRTRDGVREAVAPIRVQAIGEDDVVIAVIGRDPLGLPGAVHDATGDAVPGRVSRAPTGEDRRVRTGLVGLPAVPRQSAGWSSVDLVVWPDADPSQLSETQVQALRGFVADGGHLLVTVTDTWRQVAASPLAEVLPVELTGQRDADVTPLVKTLGGGGLPSAEGVGGGTAPIAVGRLLPRALLRASTTDGDPLWISAPYGTGSVHVLLADLGTAPLLAVRNEATWRALLTLPPPGGNAADELARNPRLSAPLREALNLDPIQPYADFDTYTTPDVDLGWESRMREKLADIPGVAPLPLPWLAAFSLAYLLAIGPLDWLVLRLLGRQPLTWITFPILIAIFSGVSLALTTFTKGSQAVLVRIEVVDLLADAGLARGTTMIGIFSTGKNRIGIQSGFEDGVVEPLAVPGFQDSPVVEGGGGPGRLEYGAETWTLAYARTQWTAPFDGTLTVTPKDGGWVVENGLPFDLTDTAVLIPDVSGGFVAAFAPLGPLPRGASVTLPAAPASRALTSADLTRPVEWAARFLSPSLPATRGALDGEHRAVFVGVADDQLEPVVISGIRPETKRTLVVRAPLDGASLVADFEAFTAILSLDSSLANTSGNVTCPDGTSQGAYPVDGVIRLAGLTSPDCELVLWTPSGEHKERVRPGSRLRCRTVTGADEDFVTCSSTETP